MRLSVTDRAVAPHVQVTGAGLGVPIVIPEGRAEERHASLPDDPEFMGRGGALVGHMHPIASARGTVPRRVMSICSAAPPTTRRIRYSLASAPEARSHQRRPWPIRPIDAVLGPRRLPGARSNLIETGVRVPGARRHGNTAGHPQRARERRERSIGQARPKQPVIVVDAIRT